jgi:hypothetical protein
MSNADGEILKMFAAYIYKCFMNRHTVEEQDS